jgi:hypothetical protein
MSAQAGSLTTSAMNASPFMGDMFQSSRISPGRGRSRR